MLTTRSVSRIIDQLLANREGAAEWSAKGDDFRVSVNLTAIDLLDLELPDRLEALLAERGVAGESLCIELTESTVMADPDRARSVLERMAAIGVRISVDDFGTGHSSLAYLKDLPVDELKIDRSFVSGIAVSEHDRKIVQATIHLAHSLGFEVVGEGVERREVRDLLEEFCCDVGQGYFYGRPEPAELVSQSPWVRQAA